MDTLWLKEHRKLDISEDEILYLIEKFKDSETFLSLDFDSIFWDWMKNVNIFMAENNLSQIDSMEVTNWNYIIDNFPDASITWENWQHYVKSGPIDGAIEFAFILNKIFGDRIQVVTASHDSFTDEKDKLIKEVFGFKKIIHTFHKSEHTKNTILIDDAVHNIKCHAETHKDDVGLLFDNRYGWNQEKIEDIYDNVYRLTSYEDIFRYFRDI